MKRLQHRIGSILLLALVLFAGDGCTRRVRVHRLLNMGNRDFNEERYDDAEIDYKNVLRLDHLNAMAFGQLGRVCAKEGRVMDAHFLLQKAVGLEPNSLPFQLAYGQIEAALRDTTNASIIAARILKAQPTNGDALLLLAESYSPAQGLPQAMEGIPDLELNPNYHTALGLVALRQQKLAEAGNEFRLALAANPKSSETYFAMAELDVLQKDGKAAAGALKMSADLAPLRSPMRIRYIDYLIRSGSIDEAHKLFQELTDKAPDYIPGWVGMMNLALAEKKYDDAGKIADTILGRDQINYDALTGRGTISLATGDAAKAVLQFERMDSIYKRNYQVKYNLAAAYLMAHDKIKAVQNLNEALALNPLYPQAVLLLAQLDIRGGDPASAVALLTRFIKRAPNVAQPYFLLAEAYLAQRQPEGALAVYRELGTLFPKNPQIPFLIGNVLAGEHQYTEARDAYEKSLAMAPEYLAAAEQLINLDIVEHNFPAATGIAKAQISKSPKASEPWELLAKVDLAQSNNAAAEADLQKAIDLNPNSPTAYLLVSEVYADSTNYQKALESLDAVVQRTNSPSAYLQIAAIREQTKEYEKARDAYEKVLEMASNSIPALNNLAYIYAVRLNDPDRGLKLVERARELAPDNPNIGDTMGWILYKKGDYPRAMTMLEEAAERSPNDPEVQFHLGMAHYMLDEEDAARLALQRSVESPRDFANKDEARRRLSLLEGSATEAELEKTLKDFPDDPVVLNRLGTLQERQGALDKAADTFETALKQNPDSVPVMTKLAWLYAYKLNEPDKASPLAADAHKLAPDNAEASAVLGHLIYHSGTDYRRAVNLLESAADRLSGQPEFLYDLAWAYYSVGRLADAQTTMQKALQMGGLAESGEAKKFLTLADALNSEPAAQAAAGLAAQTLQTDSRYVPALMISGVADQRAGNFTGARDAYSKALEVFPQFVPAARQLAILYAEYFSDDANGYPLAEMAYTAYPDDPAVAKSLGILGYYQSKYSRSAELLRQCIAQNGADAELYFYLGMDYSQLKQNKESKQALTQALSLKLPEKLAAQARRTLAGS